MPNDTSSIEDKTVSNFALKQTVSRDGEDPSSAGSVEVSLPRSKAPESCELADAHDQRTYEQKRPPLPPRPTNLSLLQDSKSLNSPKQKQRSTIRPQLQSTPTTAIQRTAINTHAYQDGTRETFASAAESAPPQKSFSAFGSIRKLKGVGGSEGADTASIRSLAPTLSRGGDNESLLGNIFGASQDVPAWKLFSDQEPREIRFHTDSEITVDFYREFDSIESVDQDGKNEEQLLSQWRSKRKHFLILSTAGKPIYSRHGDDNLISSSIGVIQTIISFYEGSKDELRGFTAGGARFVIMSQGPLYLVAISKLRENDAQLRSQLEALYMQILSTLTLPTLNHLFANRPSTDLRRPLKGSEVLLSALADTFTRGSPTALLSALECLKLKKSQRQIIDDTLLRGRSDSLLYGLVVAGGRLVSVVRPRKHSLHPSDLQLIFNMLFEADGIKAGGGENWIPICLPGFNKNGYLYMYVSFVSASEDGQGAVEDADHTVDTQNTIAVLLLSANKESFYELRKMRDHVVEELEKSGSMTVIRDAIQAGRHTTTDVVPGTVLRHFLYKSKGNVQFVMPSYDPHYTTVLARRKLLTLYHTLHADVHSKGAHLKVQHCTGRESISLAWITPLFELYCVAGPNASRNALAQSADRVIQWVRREEERVFIIGGAVF